MAETGAANATACAAGRYATAGASYCPVCPAGTTSESGSSACAAAAGGTVANAATDREFLYDASVSVTCADAERADASVASAVRERLAGFSALAELAATSGFYDENDGAVALRVAATYTAAAGEDLQEAAARVGWDLVDGLYEDVEAGGVDAWLAANASTCTIDVAKSLERVLYGTRLRTDLSAIDVGSPTVECAPGT